MNDVAKGTRFNTILKCLGWSRISRFCEWRRTKYPTLALLCFASSLSAQSSWQTLAPGIEYQDLQKFLIPWAHVHVFRIQVSQHPLALISARSIGLKMAFASELAEASHAKLAVNGGFFDSQFRPLGLRIHEGENVNPIKGISWWWVFYIQDGQAHLVRSRVFVKEPSIRFAIQSGPRLLANGQIPSLKAGRDERTALGIAETGEVLIVATENSPMTTTELAELMRKPPISAKDALNLDGGSSTQLYADFPSLKLDLHGFALVADAVVVN